MARIPETPRTWEEAYIKVHLEDARRKKEKRTHKPQSTFPGAKVIKVIGNWSIEAYPNPNIGGKTSYVIAKINGFNTYYPIIYEHNGAVAYDDPYPIPTSVKNWFENFATRTWLKTKGKGWHEPQKNEQGKSPGHQAVANKRKTKGVSRTPMVKATREEKLLKKWKAHLDRQTMNRRGFDMFDYNSGESTVEQLSKIIEGGQEALDAYTLSLSEDNLEAEYNMFKSGFEEFLKGEGLKPDVLTDEVGVPRDEDEFRFAFEEKINWNVEKLFDFNVLLIEKKHYDVSYDGVSSGIDPGDKESTDFKNKALKYITEKQLDTILANSYGGVGYFGIIINAQDIIRALRDNKKTVNSNEVLVGIHDWLNGAGYYQKATVKPEYTIKLEEAELDDSSYGVGGVFGSSEWRWR